MPPGKQRTTIPNRKRCQAHIKYRCRNKNAINQLTQTTSTKTDRRTIQGGGAPNIKERIYKNRISYNPEMSKWICSACGKQYAPQSQQNAIHHECKHFEQTKQAGTEVKWAPKTKWRRRNVLTPPRKTHY